ncbi:hypothetical protein REPUB_Repub18cG0008200 [Reevesia pubescens]
MSLPLKLLNGKTFPYQNIGIWKKSFNQPNPLLQRAQNYKKIEQFHDERVRLSFARNSVDLRQTSRSENSSILLPFQNFSSISNSSRQYSQTPRRASISSEPNLHSARAFVSSIPSIPTTTRTNLRGVNNSSNIPRPIYTRNQEPEFSPPMSPTYSSMTDNPNITEQNEESEIHMLQKDFQINKEECNKEFFSDKNKKKRKHFWKNHSEDKKQIQEEYYKFMNNHKIQIRFF